MKNLLTYCGKDLTMLNDDYTELDLYLEQDQTVYVGDWPIPNTDYLGLEYEGLGIDACSLIRNYDRTISCTSDQKVFAQFKREGQNNLVNAWPDLTSKLRVD